MPNFNKLFKGYVEGPLGFPMKEDKARAVETIIKDAPKGKEFEYRRVAKAATNFELKAGERADVSTITTDAVDRAREVVIPKGLDLTNYNGVVTWCHMYDAMPMGRNEWIKEGADGKSLIAKTKYHARPDGWEGDWFPDAVVSMMQEGGCTGKSIGFIPLGYREPSADEIKTRPELGAKNVYIIDKSVLLEYAVAPVPCNPDAETIAVSKGLVDDEQFALIAAKAKEMILGGAKKDEVVAVLTRATLIEQLTKQLPSPQLVMKKIEERIIDAYDRATGRV
jgi:hypothetical protein